MLKETKSILKTPLFVAAEEHGLYMLGVDREREKC